MFQLMCKNEVRAIFDLSDDVMSEISNLIVLGQLPIGCTVNKFSGWLNTRHSSKHRKQLDDYLKSVQCDNLAGFLSLTHGISINDCYWVKKDSESVTWEMVSPFHNDFDDTVQCLAFDGAGLYGFELSSTSPEFGTSGSFDKCWIREHDGIYLYKRGSDIASNSGLEPYCEVLASQIFTKLTNGVHYDLVNFRGKVASKCKLFNSEDVSFVPYGMLPDVDGQFAPMLRYYSQFPNCEQFSRMVVCDAITLNVDRHMGNHGVLCDSMSGEIKSVAPAFDYNLSMLPYVVRDEFANISDKICKEKSRLSVDFLPAAKHCMTTSIRNDLLSLRGIELSLPFTDEKFPEERVEWMTDIVNHQIDNILYDRTPVYPSVKVDGLSSLYQYKLKYGFLDEDSKWIPEIARLYKVLEAKSMADLEEKVKQLL